MRRVAILLALASSICSIVKGQGGQICGTNVCKPGEECGPNSVCKSVLCDGCSYCGRDAIQLKSCSKGFKCIDPAKGLCQRADAFCFPGSSAVSLEGGTTKIMADLVVGDRVQVILPDGTLGFERVFAFSHRGCLDQMQTVVLETTVGEVVEASTGHYTLLGEAREPALMADVRVGDTVWVAQRGRLAPTTVTNIYVKMGSIGAYAPHTASGTIIASNVAMSCFTDYMRPALASPLLVPVRLLSEALDDVTAQRLNDIVLRLLNKGVPCPSLPEERERESFLDDREGDFAASF